MKIGFHTDAFNSAYWNFEKCLEWAAGARRPLHRVRPDRRRELDPRPGLPAARRALRGPAAAAPEDGAHGVRFSQVDAAFPLSGKEGPLYGVPYVLKSIPWAKPGRLRADRHDRRPAPARRA